MCNRYCVYRVPGIRYQVCICKSCTSTRYEYQLQVRIYSYMPWPEQLYLLINSLYQVPGRAQLCLNRGTRPAFIHYSSTFASISTHRSRLSTILPRAILYASLIPCVMGIYTWYSWRTAGALVSISLKHNSITTTYCYRLRQQ